MRMYQIVSIRAHLQKRHYSGPDYIITLVTKQGGQVFRQLWHHCRIQSVAFRYRQRRAFPHVSRHVRHSPLDSQSHDLGDHWYPDPGHHSDGHCSDDLILVVQSFLDRVDGKEREVRFGFGIPQQIDVHELLDLQRRRSYVLDDVSEEFGAVRASRHHLGLFSWEVHQ
jgi:hypothetical protein